MVADKAVPQQAADRFALTFVDFIKGVRKALDVAADHPNALRWKRKGLPFLERNLAEVEAAIKTFTTGDQQPLVRAASSAMSLAKTMDGFPLDFAGEESGEELAEQRRLIVMAAWQVLHGAGLVR